MEKQYLVNNKITSSRVMLILPDGKSMGVVDLYIAKDEARKAELDLVEVNSAAIPPIVKILDFNKYRYEQSKQARGSKAKNPQLKEIRLGLNTQDHDLSVKAARAKGFLKDGDLVRVFINLRGRENLFPDKARVLLNEFALKVEGQADQPPSQIGKRVQLTIRNKK